MIFIPNLDSDDIQKAAQRALDAFLGLNQAEFNPKGRRGGFFAITSRFGGHLFLCSPFGEIVPLENAARYSKNAAVVKPNMLRWNTKIQASSQAQDERVGHWGGAIAIKPDPADFTGLVVMLGTFENVHDELVLSFSGLPPEGDEGLVICAAFLLGLLTLGQAREMADSIGNNTALEMITTLVDA